jgi:hypothetical protein
MWRLAVASCSALFLELCCIRWAGSHVLYLSYVSNLLLVTAFLGLGLGATLAPRLSPRAMLAWTASGPLWLLAFVSSVALFNMEVVIDGGKVVYFGAAEGETKVPPWLALSALGLLMSCMFSTLGVVIGRELRAAAPLRAYSVDIGGSLVGIVLFGCAAWLGVPAHVWFALALMGFLALGAGPRWILAGNALVALVILGLVTNADWGSLWSPYQRVQVTPLPISKPRAPGDPTAGSPRFRLEVNNVVHQYITDVRKREPFYEFAYRAAGARLPGKPETFLTAKPPAANWDINPFTPRADAWKGRVAIIGAGNGTDTAAALAYGAAHIDAVEIDPTLAHIGQALQPNGSLNDPRVSLHLMDGRTFLERAEGTYDVIVFGLPDSLTLASPYAGVRLESFLFTIEAFRSALRLLHPERGLIVLYNYYRTRWLVDRIANTLGRAAGHKPLVLLGPDEHMSAAFIAGPGLARVDPKLGSAWNYVPVQPDASVGEASDDWPFLYLRERVVPQQILVAACMLVGMGLLAALGIGYIERKHPAAQATERGGLLALAPFFFMGVAFLLLETSGLVRMSLLFGATWFVNALVFGSVLTMVLLANYLAHVWPMQRSTPLFLLLLAALAGAWALAPATFSAWHPVSKYLACSVVLFVPILLGNLAFAQAFRASVTPAKAFGANLLGAVVGGVCENFALITGYRALFLVAGVLYLLVWITFPARGLAAQSGRLFSAVGMPPDLSRSHKGVVRRGS